MLYQGLDASSFDMEANAAFYNIHILYSINRLLFASDKLQHTHTLTHIPFTHTHIPAHTYPYTHNLTHIPLHTPHYFPESSVLVLVVSHNQYV